MMPGWGSQRGGRRKRTNADRTTDGPPDDSGADTTGRPDRAADATSGAGGRSGGRAAAPVDPREAAREICLRQLAARPRTRAELATAMRKRGVEDDIAAEILDRYDEVGIIDDAAFARAWVTSRHHGRGLSRRALAGELRRKGVSSDEVGEALDELGPDVGEEPARARGAPPPWVE